MRILEARQPSYRYEPLEFVSAPPALDSIAAANANLDAIGLVHERTDGKSYPALEVAVTLMLYNQNIRSRQLTDENPQLQQQINALITEELAAASPEIPMYPQGIEVEAPMAAYRKQQNHTGNLANYGEFFATVRMPQNFDSSVETYWEFSPPPAYSAGVNARIISELIKGRFIPSLTPMEGGERAHKNPAEIQKRLLTECLVSLHGNYGIPQELSLDGDILEISRDMQLFATSFALGYTSPLRLENRKRKEVGSEIIVNPKMVTATTKGSRRLEVKAFEVRDESVYRLLEDSQLIAASLFAYYAGGDQFLATQWSEIKSALKSCYPDGTEFTKLALAELLNEIGIQDTMIGSTRSVLSYYAHVIDDYIEGKKQVHKAKMEKDAEEKKAPANVVELTEDEFVLVG